MQRTAAQPPAAHRVGRTRRSRPRVTSSVTASLSRTIRLQITPSPAALAERPDPLATPLSARPLCTSPHHTLSTASAHAQAGLASERAGPEAEPSPFGCHRPRRQGTVQIRAAHEACSRVMNRVRSARHPAQPSRADTHASHGCCVRPHSGSLAGKQDRARNQYGQTLHAPLRARGPRGKAQPHPSLRSRSFREPTSQSVQRARFLFSSPQIGQLPSPKRFAAHCVQFRLDVRSG